MRHRVLSCPRASSARDAWEPAVREALQEALPETLDFLRIPSLGATWPGPMEEEVYVFERWHPELKVWVDCDEASFAWPVCRLEFWVDGSAYRRPCGGEQRAGWSVVLVAAAGAAPLHRWYGPLAAKWPQTSQHAEWMAAAQAVLRGRPDIPIHSDCQNVVRVMQKEYCQSLLRGGPLAAHLLVIAMAAAQQGGQNVIHKVRAHTSAATAADDWAQHVAVANDLADTAAKLGARGHPQASEGERVIAGAARISYRNVVQAVAEAHALFPPPSQVHHGGLERPERQGRRCGRRQPLNVAPVEEQHRWEEVGGRVMCQACSVQVRSWQATHSKRWVESCCKGRNDTLAELVEDQRGHQLALFTAQGQAGMLCLLCGAHSSTRMHYLKMSCPKKPQSRTMATAIARFSTGLHPHQGKCVKSHRKVDTWMHLPAYLLAEAADRG